MAKELASTVHGLVHPKTGRVHSFGPGDEVPGWAAEKIKNPAAWVDDRARRVALDRPDSADLQASFDQGREEAVGDLLDRAGVESEDELLELVSQARAASEPTSDGNGGDNTPELPAKSANKPEWKAYAMSQGMSEEDADKATLPELIEKYTEQE